MAAGIVSPSLCGDLRTQASEGASSSELAEEHDLSVGTIRYHIYGDCGHDVDTTALTPDSPEISEEECHKLRTQFAAGDAADDIAQEFGHTWKTTARHISGECSHDGDELTVDRHEILQRRPVTAEACESLRKTYHESKSSELLTLSQTVPWSYQTVLKHINGDCKHDIAVESREIKERANITAKECRKFREKYRNNTNLTVTNLGPLAEEFEASEDAIQTHIRFNCSHDPESSLLDDIDGWEKLVTEDTVDDKQLVDTPETKPSTEPIDVGQNYTEIAAETGVSSPDSTEIVADIGEPDPDRIETSTSRIVRNTTLAKELKEYYQHHCQVCGDVRHKAPLEHYAEAHHIKPLGRPHEGPDIKANILVLCPNHHSDFDHGLVYVEPDSLEVTHATDESVSGQTLNIKEDHEIDPELLEYHNKKISKL